MLKKSYAIIGMILTFVFGVVVGSMLSDRPTSVQKPQQAVSKAAKSPENPRIAAISEQLAKDAKNAALWVELGNLFFDDDRPKDAIAAYEMALSLGAKNADVLTDLGIMYRRTKQYDRALQVFQEAKNLDPNHIQSRMNAGIVFYYDLSQVEPALAMWDEVLRLNPKTTLGNGELLQSLVERLKTTKP